MRVGPLSIACALFALSALSGTCEHKSTATPGPSPSESVEPPRTPDPDASTADLSMCTELCDKLADVGCKEGYSVDCEQTCVTIRAQRDVIWVLDDKHMNCLLNATSVMGIRKCGVVLCKIKGADEC